MLIIGIIAIIGAIVLINRGTDMNQDFTMIWQYGPNPGNQLIHMGYVLLIIGALLVIAHFVMKQMKNKENASDAVTAEKNNAARKPRAQKLTENANETKPTKRINKVSDTEKDLTTLTVAELKNKAKEMNIKGYHKMRKAELLEVLNEN